MHAPARASGAFIGAPTLRLRIRHSDVCVGADKLLPFLFGALLSATKRPARGARDFVQRKLGRSIHIKQAVGLLIGVGEVRVSEARTWCHASQRPGEAL